MLVFALYVLLSPLIWLLAIPFAALFKKGRLRISEERRVRRAALNKIAKVRGNRKLIIFHAASAGEFEQLKPLLEHVDRKRFCILQTFYSHTVYSREKDSLLFDAACYHPLDSIVNALVFFLRLRPDLYVVNRHDLWPSHITAAKVLRIRSAIINANMHERSYRYRFPVRSSNRMLFEMLDLVLCGSARLESNIRKLAPLAEIQITGETRFEQVILRARANRRSHFDGDIMDRQNIVLGSIIPSDYDVIFGGIRSYWERTPNARSFQRIIAVPHEVKEHDVARLESALQGFGFSGSRYSVSSKPSGADVQIVDCVGILAELYGYGKVAYVGAGFGAGVHSVIEPAVHGVPVFFGPNIHILDEAVLMRDRGIGTVVTDARSVADFLSSLDDPGHYEKLRQATLMFVESAAKASENIYTALCREPAK